MKVDSVVQRCLQDAVTPGLCAAPWAELDPATTASLTDRAVAHGVQGWVRRRAAAAGVAMPGIAESVHVALIRHQQAIEDLRVVHRALRSIDLPYLIVKGPALVAQFYPGAELRSSVDLDVLIRPGDIAAALPALEDAGCTLLDANWPLLSRLRVHELRLAGPTGGIIDLHWSLGDQPVPADRSPSASTLLARGRDIVIAGEPVRTLDWADTVVHLAVHAASSGADRLIWYADLRAALAAAPAGGEQVVVNRAGEWGAGPTLQLMLSRARRAIGLQPPEGLLGGLTETGLGAAWSGLVRAVDRIAPVAGADPGHRSVGRLVARSTRQDAASSWRALASKSLRVLGPGSPATPAQLRDPYDPRSGLFPSGGAAGREAFLAQVASRT